jgi:hypothetical protein
MRSGVLDHHRGVALDLVALKCGLGQSSLPSPEITLAGQEPLADQWNQPPGQLVFHKFISMRSQNVIDKFGIYEHVGRLVSQSKVNDVTVFPHGRGQEAELISQVGEGASQKETTFRPGRQFEMLRGVDRHQGSLFLV